MAQQLITGDTFPDLTLNIAGGDTLNLPQDLDTPYTMVLFYRGHW